MHEFNIIQNIFPILENIARKNRLKSIEQVTLQIGKLRQVVPETLKFAFKTLAEKSIAQEAELIIEEIPIKLLCRSCQQSFTAQDNLYLCPSCESSSLEIVTGKELILASIYGKKEEN